MDEQPPDNCLKFLFFDSKLFQLENLKSEGFFETFASTSEKAL